MLLPGNPEVASSAALVDAVSVVGIGQSVARSIRLRSACALTVCIALAFPALACGPNFPNRLLDDRVATLENLLGGTFAYEAAHLIPKPDNALVAVESRYYEDVPTKKDAGPAPSARAQRMYALGAEAFHADDHIAARDAFIEMLELPPAELGNRKLDAMYSLGRVQAMLDTDEAQAAFQRVRASVLDGTPDPDGLAVASFGEEARVRLDAEDFVGAVRLYSEQAARGSTSGTSSLLFVARDLFADAEKIDDAIGDPLVQRLLAAYLFTRDGELDEERITMLLDTVQKRGIDRLEGAEHLAAAAYRSARYALAAKLAARSEHALAWWVRAKLALRDGDVTTASAAYAKAAQAFPASEDWGSVSGFDAYEQSGGFSPQCRVQAEIGVLSLSRGEYVAALGYLYEAGAAYWEDVAYVAERVVTIDELRFFVDAHAPAATGKASTSEQSASMSANLRSLLARRMLRSGRGDEAVAYFDDVELAGKAQRYASAHKAMEQGGRIERAEAGFIAAKLARMDGMALLGYELDPDYHVYGGNFDLATPGHYNEKFEWVVEPRKDVVLPGRYVGKDEAARLDTSRANPLERFHYRYLAVDLASRAADLLPTRSQAYVAVLCAATGWINNTDHARAETLWLRYVKDGAYVPWAADFGNQCMEPDFLAAAKRLRFEQIATIKKTLRASAPYALGVAAISTVLLAWLFMRRRRAKAMAGNS